MRNDAEEGRKEPLPGELDLIADELTTIRTAVSSVNKKLTADDPWRRTHGITASLTALMTSFDNVPLVIVMFHGIEEGRTIPHSFSLASGTFQTKNYDSLLLQMVDELLRVAETERYAILEGVQEARLGKS